MCGIFAVISKNKKKLNKERCIKSISSIYNRGPDYMKYKFFDDGTFFIANTILSITGKLKNDNQVLNSGRYYISFNGEIYNYKELFENYLPKYKFLNKDSDTNVLLHLHEILDHKKIPTKLNGMFAYLIYDLINKKITIVNDPQGEKSLYHYEDNNYFIVSSNIRSILDFIGNYKLNLKTIENYYKTRHYMPLEKTCFEGIEIFPQGTFYTYDLKNNKHFLSTYENPIDWICEKKYEYFNKLTDEEIIDFFDYQLNSQIKLMIPKIKFGCIISGGIDSTLQAAIISKYSAPDVNLVIDYGYKKDQIASQISIFQKYFKNKIEKINCKKKDYLKFADSCYDVICSPMQTHDLPGRYIISKNFSKKNCKVFFSADGCDEIFAGQQIYYNLYKKKFNFNNNISPYSSYHNLIVKNDDQNYFTNQINNKWKEIYKKYEFVKCAKSRNILSSLFLDYTMQSTSVANRSNDLVCCSNSVEPRNVFIQKKILMTAFNLNLKFKLNYKLKPIYRQKYILKKLFERYLNKKLILKKQGFSGYPEEIINKTKIKREFSKKVKNIRKKSIKNYVDKKNFYRDLSWKIANEKMFLKKFFLINNNYLVK